MLNKNFEYAVAYEPKVDGLTIRSVNDCSEVRFVVIACFETVEEAATFVAYIRQQGGVKQWNKNLKERMVKFWKN